MPRTKSTTEVCRRHANDRLFKKREEIVRAGNAFNSEIDRTWENLKNKDIQSIVSTDDWLKSKSLLKIIFSRIAEISPPLASGLDDTLYELEVSEANNENRFVVLVNIKNLVNRLVSLVDDTKFLMCFDPSIFWQDPRAVEDHFENQR